MVCGAEAECLTASFSSSVLDLQNMLQHGGRLGESPRALKVYHLAAE